MANITITIPDDKIAEFKLGFLRYKPVPVDDDGVPEVTEVQHIKNYIKQLLAEAYQSGKAKITHDAISIDEDIMQKGS